MSTPGAVARCGLAFSAVRDEGVEVGDIENMRRMIQATARNIESPGKGNTSGFGLLKVKSLVDYLADEEREESPTWWN